MAITFLRAVGDAVSRPAALECEMVGHLCVERSVVDLANDRRQFRHACGDAELVEQAARDLQREPVRLARDDLQLVPSRDAAPVRLGLLIDEILEGPRRVERCVLHIPPSDAACKNSHRRDFKGQRLAGARLEPLVNPD